MSEERLKRGSSINSSVSPASSALAHILKVREVEGLVSRALNSAELQVLDFCVEPYSDKKIGFLSSHLRLRVKIRARNREETLQFFAKTIPYDAPAQAEYIICRGVFEQENIFYREIVPQLDYRYHAEPWAPTCYLARKDLMVFEDLHTKRYSMRGKFFGKELVLAGLSTIARFHAASLLAEGRLGNSFVGLYPEIFEQKYFTRDWFNAGVDTAMAIADELGLDSTAIPLACEQLFRAIKPSSSKANVISHGDLWGNNFMFTDDEKPKCLLVDFQLMRYSPLAHDVMQFLYLCTERSFREIWEESLVKHYYAELCATLRDSEISVPVPPFSELIEGVEEQRVSAAVTATLFFPTVLLDEEGSMQLTKNSEYFTTVDSRRNIVIANMKRDKEYGRRIGDIVTELVELITRLDDFPEPS
ncbi:hypothetical protein KM043_004750 [Ampulex compressa]|nr:hypothetical protein KM043_004750 [Ampulex compressa]